MNRIELPPGPHNDDPNVIRFAASAFKPLGPNQPRLHHFIPKSFLKHFADDEKRVDDKRIVTIRLDEPDKPRTGTVRTTAAIKDFYTSNLKLLGDSVAFEVLLGDVDGAGVDPIKRLIAGYFMPPTTADREHLATWLAFLYVRGPHPRRQMEAINDLAFQQALTARTKEAKDLRRSAHGLKIKVVRHHNDYLAQMAELARAIHDLLIDRRFTVLQFPSDGLILSDHPITLDNREQTALRGIGVANADEIWLPLNRRTALLLHSYEEIPEQAMLSPFTIEDMNRRTIRQSFDEIYCHPDDVSNATAALITAELNQPLLMTDTRNASTDVDGVNTPPRRKRPNRYRFSDDPRR